jgi:N-acetylneuraminic acid mutarotase
MNDPRQGIPATLLPSDVVLVSGGLHLDSCLRSAELYLPKPGKWVTEGSLSFRRAYHSQILLLDGRVLAAGGVDEDYVGVAPTELFDLTTGRWTTTGSLNKVRMFHSANLLPDGEVLVTGGYSNQTGFLDSAEIYDPANGTWSELSDGLLYVREGHTGTTLQDGSVLIVGGYFGQAIGRAERYIPD